MWKMLSWLCIIAAVFVIGMVVFSLADTLVYRSGWWGWPSPNASTSAALLFVPMP